MAELDAPHIAGCPAQPADDRQPSGRFCVACAQERRVDQRAFLAFARMAWRWFVQPTVGRG